MLLVHGEKDRVVRVNQGKAMARALKRAKKDHRYVELEDGTHYLSNEVNRVRFFEEMDQFLDLHLGQ